MFFVSAHRAPVAADRGKGGGTSVVDAVGSINSLYWGWSSHL